MGYRDVTVTKTWTARTFTELTVWPEICTVNNYISTSVILLYIQYELPGGEESVYNAGDVGLKVQV